MATRKRRRNKVEKKSPKRISAALSRYLKKMNPAKMRGVSHVRVRKLKNGGLTITPVRSNIAEGYMAGGIFHPIRASYDYSVLRSGEATPIMRKLTGGGKKRKKRK